MRVAVIGAGAIARRVHLPILGIIPDIQVVGIADTDRNTVKRAANEFCIPRFCESIQELLEDDSIEMIDICTPTSTHTQIIEFAANKGKHILVEKPLAITLSDCIKIQKIINDVGVKLCVVQNWRYYPAVTAVKERIANGFIGKTVTIHGLGLTTFPSNWTSGTWLYHKSGVIYDFAPHLIDSMLYIKEFSPIKRVYASGGDFSQGNMDFINYAVINMEFADGSLATADISWLTSTAPKFTIDIYGTAGNIFLDVRNNAYYETHGFPTPIDDMKYFLKKTSRTAMGVITGNYFKGTNANLRPIIIGFMNAISGQGEIPVPVENAVATGTVLEAAVLSIERKEPITIEEMLQKAY